MPTHKCGNNGYRGVARSEAVAAPPGPNVFQIFFAFAQARLAAWIKVNEVYGWSCPDNCKSKSGLVAYDLLNVRRFRDSRVIGGNLRKFVGVEFHVGWRLLVQCVDKDTPSDPNATELPWEDLQDFLEEVLVAQGDALETELQHVE